MSSNTHSSSSSCRLRHEKQALDVVNNALTDRNIVDLFRAEDGAQVLSVLKQHKNDPYAAAEQLLFTRAIEASSASSNESSAETTSQNNNLSDIPNNDTTCHLSNKSADDDDKKKSHAPLHNPTPAPPTLLNKNGGTSVGKNNEMNIITSRLSSSSSPTSALEDLFKSSSTNANEEESKVWHCVSSYSYLLLLHTRI